MGPTLQNGMKVEVWSHSKQSWFEGVVLEVSAVDTDEKGLRVPRGSCKVLYSETTMKWIWPEHVQQLLRPASRMSGI